MLTSGAQNLLWNFDVSVPFLSPKPWQILIWVFVPRFLQINGRGIVSSHPNDVHCDRIKFTFPFDACTVLIISIQFHHLPFTLKTKGPVPKSWCGLLIYKSGHLPTVPIWNPTIASIFRWSFFRVYMFRLSVIDLIWGPTMLFDLWTKCSVFVRNS